MRNAFVDALTELARSDPRVVLLTGDLGYLVVENFAAEFPDRFFNVGVAEQNMAGIATGLAEAGLIPYLYSIVSFASLRAIEFIRNGPVQHRLPVRIAAIGEGVGYGANGPSHFGLEDIAVMRALGNITVIAPADREQTIQAVKATVDLDTPIYFRLGKNSAQRAAEKPLGFSLGTPDEVIGGGRQLLLLSSGSIVSETLSAAAALGRSGISPAVYSLATLSREAEAPLRALLAGFPTVVTVEEHLPGGGLGTLTAELLAESGCGTKLLRLALNPELRHNCGSQQFLRKLHGIDGEGIAARILSELNFMRGEPEAK